jgi:hypothetical protein
MNSIGEIIPVRFVVAFAAAALNIGLWTLYSRSGATGNRKELKSIFVLAMIWELVSILILRKTGIGGW